MNTANELKKFSRGTRHMKKIAVHLTLRKYTKPEKPVEAPKIKKRSFIQRLFGG